MKIIFLHFYSEIMKARWAKTSTEKQELAENFLKAYKSTSLFNTHKNIIGYFKKSILSILQPKIIFDVVILYYDNLLKESIIMNCFFYTPLGYHYAN